MTNGSVNYLDVKKAVEQWIVENKRKFTADDCKALAAKFPDYILALDYAYTAACYYENCPIESNFARCNNFSVGFRIKRK